MKKILLLLSLSIHPLFSMKSIDHTNYVRMRSTKGIPNLETRLVFTPCGDEYNQESFYAIHGVKDVYECPYIPGFTNKEVIFPKSLQGKNPSLFRYNNEFYLSFEGKIVIIDSCYLDEQLRDMTDAQLLSFLGRNRKKVYHISTRDLETIKSNGSIHLTGQDAQDVLALTQTPAYLCVSELSDGHFMLSIRSRMLGGLAPLAFVAGVLVRGIAYGAITSLANFGIKEIFGHKDRGRQPQGHERLEDAARMGGIAYAAERIPNMPHAVVGAAVIEGAGLEQEAHMGVAVAVTEAGGVIAAGAAVESVATAVEMICMACPFI